jgi:hypothetical protein
MNDPLASLVKKIDETVNAAAGKYKAGQNLGTFVIIPDAAGRADQFRSLAKQEPLKRVNLCLGVAPPRYEINPAAEVTVVIYTPGRPGQNTVTANFALREYELDDAQIYLILAALSDVLPK